VFSENASQSTIIIPDNTTSAHIKNMIRVLDILYATGIYVVTIQIGGCNFLTSTIAAIKLFANDSAPKDATDII